MSTRHNSLLKTLSNRAPSLLYISSSAAETSKIFLRSSKLLNYGHRCSSSFSIQEILPPQDAFALRHIGPRKDETSEMLDTLDLKVSSPFAHNFLKHGVCADWKIRQNHIKSPKVKGIWKKMLPSRRGSITGFWIFATHFNLLTPHQFTCKFLKIYYPSQLLSLPPPKKKDKLNTSKKTSLFYWKAFSKMRRFSMAIVRMCHFD